MVRKILKVVEARKGDDQCELQNQEGYETDEGTRKEPSQVRGGLSDLSDRR